MKIITLSKLIFDEYSKYILLSILLFAVVDIVFMHFTGITDFKTIGYAYWIGGNEQVNMSLFITLLKTVNVSAIFLTIGRIIDKISDNMVYIFSRITYYTKFMWRLTFIIVCIGLILVVLSHAIYYVVIGLLINNLEIVISYLLLDCLGFICVVLVYFILNNVFSLENSYLYIFMIYVLNTILPIPIIPAFSTVRYLELTNQIDIVALFFVMMSLDIIVVFCFKKLIQRRRVNVC